MVISDTKADLRHKSRHIVDGRDRAGARAMLRAVGLQDDDMKKPFVAIANLASDITPCNMHLDKLTSSVEQGVREADCVPFKFGTTFKRFS